MSTQPPPNESQRRHLYEKVGDPVHAPVSALSDCPSFAVPATVGGAVFAGAATASAYVAKTDISRSFVVGVPNGSDAPSEY
jgi:hypothetical protein